MSAQTFFNDAASLAKGTAANLNPFIESGAGAYTVGQLITAGKLSQAMADVTQTDDGNGGHDNNPFKAIGVIR